MPVSAHAFTCGNHFVAAARVRSLRCQVGAAPDRVAASSSCTVAVMWRMSVVNSWSVSWTRSFLRRRTAGASTLATTFSSTNSSTTAERNTLNMAVRMWRTVCGAAPRATAASSTSFT
ncbi:hypothetical protein WMF30_11010 [Sorangium sp. So ce134]